MNNPDKKLLSKINLKQKKISKGNSAPTRFEGFDGELTIRNIIGQGIFLFYKSNGRWYSSRFSSYTRTTHERNEPVYLPKGRKPKSIGEITLDKDNKVKLKKSAAVSQMISVDKENNADTNTYVTFNHDVANTTAPSTSNASMQIFNNAGDSRLSLKCKPDAAADAYVNYISYNTSTGNWDGWSVGLNTSNGSDANLNDSYVWNVMANDGLTTASTTAQTKMSLSRLGALVTAGTITSSAGACAGPITYGISDTNVTKCGAGIVDDDFIRVNGTTFEGRSASEVRSDIGAGTSSVGALND